MSFFYQANKPQGDTLRGKQVRQICDVLDALSVPEGATIRELEAKLAVTRRTVERLLATMQEMKFPIFDEKREGEGEKRWCIESTYVLKVPNTIVPNLTISYHEMMCLCLLNRDDPIFTGTRIQRTINTVFTKLSHLFPREFTKALGRMQTLRVTKPLTQERYAEHQETLGVLTNAILHQESVRLCYHKYTTDSPDTLEIHPLHLFEEDGGIYLIAQKMGSDDFRTYAVERIKRIRTTGAEYNYPEGFDPQVYLGGTFGIVDDGPIELTLRFSQEQAHYAAERTWVAGQTLHTNPDGTVDLHFSTRGVRDVKKWVLGWGGDVEVLSPDWFRKDIGDELKKMVKKYG